MEDVRVVRVTCIFRRELVPPLLTKAMHTNHKHAHPAALLAEKKKVLSSSCQATKEKVVLRLGEKKLLIKTQKATLPTFLTHFFETLQHFWLYKIQGNLLFSHCLCELNLKKKGEKG